MQKNRVFGFIGRKVHSSTVKQNIQVTTGGNNNDVTSTNATNSVSTAKSTKPKLPRVLLEDVADGVAAAISSHISPSSVIFHQHPGPGLVLERLVASGVGNHIIAEADPVHLQQLQDMRSLHPAAITEVIYTRNTHCFWHSITLCDFIYPRLTHVQWQQIKFVSRLEALLSVIANISPKREREFVRNLGYALITGDPLFQHGRPEFFIFLSKLECMKTCFQFPPLNLKIYHAVSAMFHLLWDAKVIHTVNKNQFTPPIRSRQKTKKQLSPKKQFSDDLMYLVHLTPKVTSLCHDCVPPIELPELVVFLKQMLVAKHARLLPKLETLVPKCGPYLIDLGYGMTTEVGQVSPQEYLHIFKEMRSWPEYQGSNLQHFTAESTSHMLYDDDKGDKSGSQSDGSDMSHDAKNESTKR